MSERDQDFSGFVGEIKRNFLRFANSYSMAVKNGANVAGQQIMEAVEEKDQSTNKGQSTDIFVEKLIAAVKKGVQHAGKEIITSGMNFTEPNNKKAKKK